MSANIEEDDYFLKWEKHHSAFVTFFSGLFRRSMLVDCTLAAEEKFIKAHRIVLMACSPYFEELLSDHCDNFPIVFLNIKFSELRAIVDFCYRGEVKVSHNELDGFLNAANMLQIRGLSDSKNKSSEKPVSNKLKRRRSSHSNVDSEKSDVNNSESSSDMKSEFMNVKDEEEEGETAKKQKLLTPEFLESLAKDLQTSEETQGSDISDVDTDDDSDSDYQDEGGIIMNDVNELLMQATGSLMFPWSCNRCGEAFASRHPYQEHRKSCQAIPSDHIWRCTDCPNTYKNKKDLVRHLNYCGKEQPRLECKRCGQTYKYDRGLKRHQRYCGTDTEPLKCPDCDKTYKYKRGLRRHQRKCAILRALNFLQKKGVTSVAPIMDKDKDNEKDKEMKIISSMTTMVCGCGKSYKYEKAFKRHRHLCSGFTDVKEEEDEGYD